MDGLIRAESRCDTCGHEPEEHKMVWPYAKAMCYVAGCACRGYDSPARRDAVEREAMLEYEDER